jgi:hypothetical protein
MPRLGLSGARLKGEQLAVFSAALQDAYADPNELDIMLRAGFGVQRSVARLSNLNLPMPRVVHEVIGKAEDQAWSRELLLNARAMNPANPALIAFAQEFSLAAGVYDLTGDTPEKRLSQGEFERLVIAEDPLTNIREHLEKLGRIERQVCRIEFPPKTAQGTGFLVGPGAVLTNFHVIKRIKDGDIKPQFVRLRFDFKTSADGTVVNPGREYKLASEWLIDDSPFSDGDEQGLKPADDELDYALLRVEDNPGNEQISETVPDDNDPTKMLTRGWIGMPFEPPSLAPGRLLFIVQHPKGEPLKVGANVIIEGGHEGLRIRYKTNTEPGSSGSPCFDIRWNLAALHHFGDPALGPAQFNQGVPISSIESLLLEHFDAKGINADEVFGK